MGLANCLENLWPFAIPMPIRRCPFMNLYIDSGPDARRIKYLSLNVCYNKLIKIM